MHASVRVFVAEEAAQMRPPVYDVGSFDVNGNLRDLLPDPYLGIDARPGPNVDMVYAVGEDPLPYGLVKGARTIVSTEMLEHCRRPEAAVFAMSEMLKADGLLLLTCRGFGYPRHDDPVDYWRFSLEGVRALLEDAGLLVVRLEDDPECSGVFALACRP